MPDLPPAKVYCVIVAYNRMAMLIEAIDAVIRQTRKPDLIIVVDNNSADGTRQWLTQMARYRNDVVPLLMDDNLGGAGGFHYGIKKAYESGADWIWTMDDDCLPDPHALQNLLDCSTIACDAYRGHVGFLASRVNWKDGSRHKMNVPGSADDQAYSSDRCPGLVKVSYASFVSILINAKAVAKVGLPIKEFFIYCDDVEFTRRITSAGFSGFLVESSEVEHLTAVNRGVTLNDLDVKPEDLTKWKYTVRNLVAVNRRRKHGLFRETARLCYLLIKLIGNRAPLRIKAGLMLAGLRGLCLDYEKWIEYPRSDQSSGM